MTARCASASRTIIARQRLILKADGGREPGALPQLDEPVERHRRRHDAYFFRHVAAALTIDSTSVWNVTANSTVTSLIDKSGISGTSITNIVGNGYTVTYNATLSANSYCGGLTYSLANGGSLIPAGSVTTSAPEITSGE